MGWDLEQRECVSHEYACLQKELELSDGYLHLKWMKRECGRVNWGKPGL